VQAAEPDVIALNELLCVGGSREEEIVFDGVCVDCAVRAEMASQRAT